MRGSFKGISVFVLVFVLTRREDAVDMKTQPNIQGILPKLTRLRYRVVQIFNSSRLMEFCHQNVLTMQMLELPFL